MSSAVAVKNEPGTDLAVPADVAAEIAASQAQEFGDDDLLSTPILKVGQALTREVTEGDAASGEFINTLTGEGLGNTVEFIPSYYNKGRFASPKDQDRAYVAFSADIPDNWADYVGEGYVGKPFAEHPESEEAFKAAVNKKERDWGSGPGISTTHNFTGYVLAEVLGEDGQPTTEAQPVRLSLKRTDVPAAKKILTLQRLALNGKNPWDVVLRLSTKSKDFGKNSAYVINPADLKIVRKTTAEEKELGAQLAQAVIQGRTNTTGVEEAEPRVEPSANGGLAV